MTAGVATLAGPVADRELAWLARARALAQRARGHVSPNPLVGAIVARGDRVVGEGWHAGPGRPHAEVVALAAAGAAARGATLVCTLEPCSHHGRTPPCTSAVLQAGVARVVIGCLDPLERRRGEGARILQAGGLDVAVAGGPEAAACRELNAAFLTWAASGRPLVTLKLATSLDGKVATRTGDTRWISGPAARALVHRWRADADAVAVGIGTALADDPLLTARDVVGPVRQPRRIVFDGRARLPVAGALARSARETPVVAVVGPDAPAERVDALATVGVEILVAAGVGDALDLLGAREVQSLFLEGGPGLAGAFVAAGVVDRVAWVLAPILVGGDGAPGALGGPGAGLLVDAPRLAGVEVTRLGEDVLVTGRLREIPGPG